MSKEKALIEALEAYRRATSVLVEAWENLQGDHGTTVGTTKYPFENSFDSVASDVYEWVEAFSEELGATPSRFWIDLQDDGGTYWVYRECDGIVYNDIGVGTREDGTLGLTEISFEKHNAIRELWLTYDQVYEGQGWNSRSIADDILDIINT